MFLLLKGELENRLDPLFYSENIFSFLKTTTFEVKKIMEINTFVKAGFGVGRQDQDLEQNGYIQIRPTNLDEDGFLKFEKNIYLPESYLETSKTNILEKEDVLFNNTNSQELVGKTAYFEEEGIFLHSNHITIIRVNKEIILPKYLWILLNIYQKRKIFFNICTNWNNQSGVGIDRLLSLKIPVPNLETQQTIISIFEKAHSLKRANEEKAKELLASIDDYLLAELRIILPEKVENTLKNRVFLRNINKLSGNRFDGFYYQNEFDLFEESINSSKYHFQKLLTVLNYIASGATSLKSESEKFYTNNSEIGIPLLRVQNITSEGLKLEDVIFINQETHHKDLKRSQVFEGDLLITITGRIGSSAVAPINFEGNINQHSVIIRTTSELINNEFLATYFNSYLGQKLVLRNATGGTRPALDYTALKNIQVPVPPLEIQEKIVTKITNIRQQAKTLQNEAKTAIEEAKRTVETMILG